MGIFDSTKKRKPTPTAGAAGAETQADDIVVPEVDDALRDIDKALAEEAAQRQPRRGGCGC